MEAVKDTKLICQRKPTAEELKICSAEVVFIRQNDAGHTFKIFGTVCYESWQQWGATEKILGDNVDDIEKWRHSL
ncbi:hypothetical protein LCGC14_0878150 [marine sediment metagenome]|uniref:Uncharacterized protein n=1 Tax=marine sediment metagenome TaxID=412755 RepID=A0A0F9S9Q6_9ZZZZ